MTMDWQQWAMTSGICGMHGWHGRTHCPRCSSAVSQPLVDMTPKRPHRCPICNGRGTVDAGFYTHGVSTGTNPETCHACGGRGIVIA